MIQSGIYQLQNKELVKVETNSAWVHVVFVLLTGQRSGIDKEIAVVILKKAKFLGNFY